MYLVISDFADEKNIYRARVIETDLGYTVEKWERGRLLDNVTFEGRHINDVEDYAEDWVLQK